MESDRLGSLRDQIKYAHLAAKRLACVGTGNRPGGHFLRKLTDSGRFGIRAGFSTGRGAGRILEPLVSATIRFASGADFSLAHEQEQEFSSSPFGSPGLP